MKPLLALGLTASFVLVAPPTLAGELVATCHGRPVTIEQTRGIIKGTTGDDVVVVSTARTVETFEGDDLVCVTGGVNHIDTGRGDDTVDATAVPARSFTSTLLGPGRDTYLGGPAGEIVNGSWMATAPGAPLDAADTEYDEITTGGGEDWIQSGAPGVLNEDRISAGAGPDTVSVGILAPTAVLDLGAGLKNRLGVDLTTAAATSWRLDLHARTITAGDVTVPWSGRVSGLNLYRSSDPSGSDLTVLGTTSDEQVDLGGSLTGVTTTLRLGAGDDAVSVLDRTADGSRYVLGSGRDQLAVAWQLGLGGEWDLEHVGVDLAAGRLEVGTDGAATSLAGVEKFLATADVVRAVGGDRGESFTLRGCDVRAKGGAGDDYLQRNGLGQTNCPEISNVLRGGPGDDRLIGTGAVDDVLIGGRGRDTARGQGGYDLCRVEAAITCEAD